MIGLLKDQIEKLDKNYDVLIEQIKLQSLEQDPGRTSQEEKLEALEKRTVEIIIANISGANELLELLNNEGYNVSIHKPPRHGNKYEMLEKDHTGVWIGSKVPLSVVKKAILVGRTNFSQIKYIYIIEESNNAPDYVYKQVFIGGAQRAADTKSLKPIPLDIWQSIDRIETLDELHDLIKRYY